MTTCTARKHRSTEPCDREAVPGLSVCEVHGGLAPQTVRKAVVAAAERELDAFIRPIPDSDPEANPVTALHEAHKRCVARIRWIEHRIADTLGADDLEWGLVSEEVVNASETPGVNRTYAAQIPVLLQLLDREQARLIELSKAMSRDQFKAAEASLQARAAELAYNRVVDILRAVHRDPADPRVVRAMQRLFSRDHRPLPHGIG